MRSRRSDSAAVHGSEDASRDVLCAQRHKEANLDKMHKKGDKKNMMNAAPKVEIPPQQLEAMWSAISELRLGETTVASHHAGAST